MKTGFYILAACLFWNISGSVFGQTLLADRAMLNALLGGSRTDEYFEGVSIQNGLTIGGDGLLSSNDPSSWGQNLVVPGVTFQAIDTNNYTIWWNGNNAGAGDTKSIMADIGLRLDFWNSTAAFGVDLKDYYDNVGSVGINVYAADRTTLLYQNNNFTITDEANGTFFGFEYLGGIGSVVFTVTSPVLIILSRAPLSITSPFLPLPSPNPPPSRSVCLALAHC